MKKLLTYFIYLGVVSLFFFFSTNTTLASYVELSNISPAFGSTINDSTPTITFNTDANATCYILDTDYGYYDMEETGVKCSAEETSEQSCTAPYVGVNGSKNLYISCNSNAVGYDPHTSSSNADLTYNLNDLTPPTKTDFLPSNSSYITDPTQTINFNTDEPASCRLSLTDESYDDMSNDVNCIAADGVEHQCTTPDLGIFGQKNVYIACKDIYDNKDISGSNSNLTYTLKPFTNIGEHFSNFPTVNDTVYSLALSEDQNTLYVGGEFTEIGGVARNYLAAIDTTTFEVTDWNPNPDGPVRTIQVYDDYIYIGGSFSFIGETYTGEFAKINLDGSLNTDCMPNIRYSPVPATVYSIEITESYIYVGGRIDSINSSYGAINNIVRLENNSTCTWDTEWSPEVNGTVFAIEAYGDDIYLGGSFEEIDNEYTGEFAKLNSDGSLNIYCTPDINTPQYETVLSLRVDNKYIYIGGSFDRIGSTWVDSIVRLNNEQTCTWDEGWQPNVNWSVHNINCFNDDIYIGGSFENIDEEYTGQFVRLSSDASWDSTWQPEIYTPLTYTVYSSVFGDNILYVGGTFHTVENEYVRGLVAFPLDKTGPVGNISINSDELYTDVQEVELSIMASDPASGVREMMICNNSEFTGCSWETYSTTKSWTLSTEEGIKTVYIKFKDGAGNVSTTYTDTITLHELALRITNINSISNIPDQASLSYFVTSTNTTIKGTTQPYNIVYITDEQQTFSSVADVNGVFTVKIFLNRGGNTLQYYTRDLSGNQSTTKTLYLTVHTPSITITNIGQINNIPDRNELTYYFTSTSARIRGITQANSTVSFEYDEEIYTAKADANGNFNITLTVERGENTILYYSTDLSGNRSLIKTLNLIVGTENFPEWLLENMGLMEEDQEDQEDEEEIEEDIEENEENSDDEDVQVEEKVEDEISQEQTGTIAPSSKIKFTNENGQPLTRAIVEIEGERYVTDSNGEINVENLENRKYEAKVRHEGKEYTAEILGAAGANIGEIVLKEDSTIDWVNVLIYAGIPLSIILITLLLIFLFKKKVKGNEQNI